VENNQVNPASNGGGAAPDYSVVIPVYNGEHTLKPLVERILQTFSRTNLSCEIVSVDDCSSDRSWEVLGELRRKHPELRRVRLRRNFGQHNAILCGLTFARGKRVITIDDDLQIPPEEIPKLIATMDAGNFDVVYGIFGRKRHGAIKNLGSAVINWYYRKIFHQENHISAFRLLKAEIARGIIRYDRNFPYIDGLISWNTREVGEVLVEHRPRTSGRSGYNVSKILKLTFNMVTNFSAFPVRVASGLGVIFALFGFGLGLYFFIKAIVTRIPVTGYASTIVAITMFSGVQLLTIGVIGEYIARVHVNINRKPQYVVRETDL